MFISKFAAIAATSLIAAAVPAAAAVNLVTNGGFETTTYTASSQIGGSFGQGVTGWTASGFNLLFIGGTQTTTSAANQYSDPLTYFRTGVTTDTLGTGGNFVALDGDTGIHGPLSQTITGLVAGQGYNVTFDWAASQLRNRTGATTEQLAVTFGGVTQSTAIINNPSAGFQPWRSVSFYFVPTGTSAVLSFLSNGTPAGAPPIALLDNISVAAVPEPASWALLVTGFSMVGYATRRRRPGVVTA